MILTCAVTEGSEQFRKCVHRWKKTAKKVHEHTTNTLPTRLMLYALDALFKCNREALALADVPTPSLIIYRHMIWAARPWPLASSRPRGHNIHTSHITRAKVMVLLLAATHIATHIHWSHADEWSWTVGPMNLLHLQTQILIHRITVEIWVHTEVIFKFQFLFYGEIVTVFPGAAGFIHGSKCEII